MAVNLSYKFENEWTYFTITDDEFIETLVEYADKYHMVTIDGKPGDIYGFIMDTFDRICEIDLGDLADYGQFGEFIHEKFKDAAYEKYEEEKEEELLADESW